MLFPGGREKVKAKRPVAILVHAVVISGLLSILLGTLFVGTCAALSLDEAAPPFNLGWLSEEGLVSSSELFAQSPFTVLVIWNRGCPRCTTIALGMPAFADSLQKSDIRVIGLLFGPDDKDALKDLLWDNDVLVPHLWDPDGKTAAAYGLGFQHLAILGIDGRGIVRAAFDDRGPDLLSLIPAIRKAKAERMSPHDALPVPPTPPEASPPSARSGAPLPTPGIPTFQIDGRTRLLSTSGVQPGDTGLYGEELENGTLFLFRYDLKATFSLASGVDLIPWLRVSDESDAVLTDGAERLSSPHGTITLRARISRATAMLGAFPLRISPLLLQRWDAEDAPPLGGVAGCGCGAGGSGLQQRSLEVLTPFYTFEGISADYTKHPFRLRVFGSVPQWEKMIAISDSPEQYRRVLGGAMIDVGHGSGLDRAYDLPAPLGLRIGYIDVGDDRRSLPPGLSLPPSESERGFVALAKVGPVRGLTADGEYVDWRRSERGAGASESTESKSSATGVRAGGRFDHRWDPVSIWADVHRIRTGVDFAPEFEALTYGPNQDGWRMAGGIRAYPSSVETRERFAVGVFVRRTRETELRAGENRRALSTIESLSFSARGVPDLLTEVHLIRKEAESPLTGSPTAKTEGISFDARWEGISVLDPMLRVDAIREGSGALRHTDWQAYLSIRVVR